MSLQLERYFFPHQEVIANPEHNPAGVHDGSKVTSLMGTAPIVGRPNAYVVEVTLSLDEGASVNPPYFFTLHAFSIWTTADGTDPEATPAVVATTGVSILIGAIREHLATLTARGPWGPFIFGPIQLQFVPTDPAPDIAP